MAQLNKPSLAARVSAMALAAGMAFALPAHAQTPNAAPDFTPTHDFIISFEDVHQPQAAPQTTAEKPDFVTRLWHSIFGKRETPSPAIDPRHFSVKVENLDAPTKPLPFFSPNAEVRETLAAVMPKAKSPHAHHAKHSVTLQARKLNNEIADLHRQLAAATASITAVTATVQQDQALLMQNQVDIAHDREAIAQLQAALEATHPTTKNAAHAIQITPITPPTLKTSVSGKAPPTATTDKSTTFASMSSDKPLDTRSLAGAAFTAMLVGFMIRQKPNKPLVNLRSMGKAVPENTDAYTQEPEVLRLAYAAKQPSIVVPKDATPEQIEAIAQEIHALRKQGLKPAVQFSTYGKTHSQASELSKAYARIEQIEKYESFMQKLTGVTSGIAADYSASNDHSIHADNIALHNRTSDVTLSNPQGHQKPQTLLQSREETARLKALFDVSGYTSTLTKDGMLVYDQTTEVHALTVAQNQVTIHDPSNADHLELAVQVAAIKFNGDLSLTGGDQKFRNAFREAAQKLIDSGELLGADGNPLDTVNITIGNTKHVLTKTPIVATEVASRPYTYPDGRREPQLTKT